MDCPRCSVELTAITQEDSSVNRCSECGGLWVDGTDLTKILLHANLPALSSIPGFVNPEEFGAGLCPACQVDLSVPEGAQVSCAATAECPDGYVCHAERCVPSANLDTTPPDLASPLEVTPAVARAGQELVFDVAVTEPLAANTGFSLARPSKVESPRGPSSRFTVKNLFTTLPSTYSPTSTSSGINSGSKSPDSTALAAFWLLLSENSSCCSRVIPYLTETFSAVSPMLV